MKRRGLKEVGVQEEEEIIVEERGIEWKRSKLNLGTGPLQYRIPNDFSGSSWSLDMVVVTVVLSAFLSVLAKERVRLRKCVIQFSTVLSWSTDVTRELVTH